MLRVLYVLFYILCKCFKYISFKKYREHLLLILTYSIGINKSLPLCSSAVQSREYHLNF